MARWRLRQTLRHSRLEELRARLESRARVRRPWGLPGELRRLADGAIVRSGSSAAADIGLDLLAPDTADGYVVADQAASLIEKYALEPASAAQANVLLRAVPIEAWLLGGRNAGPVAAVALDLAAYPDARSSRAGRELLARLDERRPDG